MTTINEFVETLMGFLVKQGAEGYSTEEAKKCIASLFRRFNRENNHEAKAKIINAITSKSSNSECVIIKRQGLLKILTEHFSQYNFLK